MSNFVIRSMIMVNKGAMDGKNGRFDHGNADWHFHSQVDYCIQEAGSLHNAVAFMHMVLSKGGRNNTIFSKEVFCWFGTKSEWEASDLMEDTNGLVFYNVQKYFTVEQVKF